MLNIIIFTLSLVIFAGLFLFLIVHSISARKYKWLLIVVPLALASSSFTIISIDAVRGWPSSQLPNRFVLLDYRATSDTIWVWAIPEGFNIPRTYSMPYSSSSHEQLEAAKKSKSKGSMVLMEKESLREGSDFSIGDKQQFKLKQHEITLPEKE